jgi:hypothetical protein
MNTDTEVKIRGNINYILCDVETEIFPEAWSLAQASSLLLKGLHRSSSVKAPETLTVYGTES